jgi:hypothetical protein
MKNRNQGLRFATLPKIGESLISIDNNAELRNRKIGKSIGVLTKGIRFIILIARTNVNAM